MRTSPEGFRRPAAAYTVSHCHTPTRWATDVVHSNADKLDPAAIRYSQCQWPHLKSEPGAGTAAASMHIGTAKTVLHGKCASHCVAAQPTCAANTSPNQMRQVLPGVVQQLSIV